MFPSSIRRCFLTLICLCLTLFTLACSIPEPGGAGNSPASTPKPTVSASGSSLTPSLTTACPIAGKGRPAVMPTLKLGKDQNIVFFTLGGTRGQISRYDVRTHATVLIFLAPPTESIQTAQLSYDGQWILMVVQDPTGIYDLQLIRVDGKYLQTLFCAPRGERLSPDDSTALQWSPDQKQVIFLLASGGGSAPLYLLHLTSGVVEQELASNPQPGADQLIAHNWLDNTRLYLLPETRTGLYILDTSKGPNQKVSDLEQVNIERHIYSLGTRWDIANMPDVDRLFINYYGVDGSGSEIDTALSSAQNAHLIYSSNTIVATQVRVAGSSTLLLSVQKPLESAEQNIGLWKINTDGSGLTHLNNLAAHDFSGFNLFSENSWSNVSRDGSLYTFNNAFGSLAGGPVTLYSTDPRAQTAGWTTM